MAIKNGSRKSKHSRRAVRGPRRASWKKPLERPAEPPPVAAEAVFGKVRPEAVEHPEEIEEDELDDV